MTYQAPLIPQAFIWRRLHSLMGLWLVLFLTQHLILNSQAALFIGDDGLGFIQGVNSIRSLPYLPVIETILLGIPFLIHGLWGIKYLFTGKINSLPTDGSSPSLSHYSRNQAYTWQRITSWILLFAIIFHVVQMRFLEAPVSAQLNTQTYYMVRLEADSGLYTLSQRLGFDMYDQEQIRSLKEKTFTLEPLVKEAKQAMHALFEKLTIPITHADNQKAAVIEQERKEQANWLSALLQNPIHDGQVIAVASDFGTAELLMVRETFKSPLMIALYSVLVLTACFHAFNGLWTFMITWGVTLSEKSQRWMRMFGSGLMVIITFLGLAAIWGTFWINLKQ